MSESEWDGSTRFRSSDEPPAQALLGYMKWFSEERWCAAWLIHLHTEMARADDPAFNWLVEQAGGWWWWPDGADGVVFQPGPLTELRRASSR
jgi:hypothetical protein